MKRSVAFVLALSLCVVAASCGLPSNGTGPVEQSDASGGPDTSTGSMDVQAVEVSILVEVADAAGADVSAAPEASSADDGSSPDETGSTDDAATEPDSGEAIPDAGADVADAMQMPEASLPDAGCACNAGCGPVTDCSACPATPYLCGGTCQKDCSQCTGASLECSATKTCMANCAACAGNPIECFACPSFAFASPTDVPVGSCNPGAGPSYCLGGFGTYPAGWHHCECATAADCPGETQVCTTNVGCQTCGEAPSAQQPPGSSTMGEACKGGGTCHGTDCK